MHRIIKGSILQIHSKDYYTYCQVLGKASYAFFNNRYNEPLKEVSLLEKNPVLFILSVYDEVITTGRWKRIGKIAIREELTVLPLEYIQDPIDPTMFSIYNPNTGDINIATREDCIGLECAAVWDAEQVEERLNDYFAGEKNYWEKQFSLK